MTLDRAIEVFVRAVAAARSRTRPCLAEFVDGLWVMRDPPGSKNPRKIEVVTWGLLPSEAVSRVRAQEFGWHFLCAIHPWESADAKAFDEARAEYKQLGYRALSTEWMFVHPLENIPPFESDPPVREIFSQAELDAIPQLAQHKRKLLAGSRMFGIWDETRDYGWVTSIPVGPDAWVQGLYVHADARRKGYGAALMSTLLRSDKEHGAGASVLLASTSGARLYPRVGYEQIAILQMFCPVSRL